MKNFWERNKIPLSIIIGSIIVGIFIYLGIVSSVVTLEQMRSTSESAAISLKE